MEKEHKNVMNMLKARMGEIEELIARMNAEAPEELMEHILDSDAIFTTGKGRSGYIAQCFAMRLMQMGFKVNVPGEATCPRIGADDLMIAVSCSGRTVTTVELARISNEAGARVVAITADAASPLASHADHLVFVPVQGEDIKKNYRHVMGPYNNTLFEEALLLYFDALIHYMLAQKGISARRLQEMHTNLE